MRKTIEIGTQEMEFKASAATPLLYKHLFKEDIYTEEQKLIKKRAELKALKDKREKAQQEGEPVTYTDDELELAQKINEDGSELTRRIAYIMHLETQYNERTIWAELELPKYIAFLMKINGGDLSDKFSEIYGLYKSSTRGSSKPKNE